MNGMFLLVGGGFDFQCPKCELWLEVEWFTEYGEPMDDNYEVSCPSCDAPFKLDVDTTTVYTPQLK
jgi:hypothetical protein